MLASGKYDAAIDYFESIIVPEDPSPHALRGLHLSEALCLFNNALGEFNKGEDPVEELVKALSEIDSALEADKELGILEGREELSEALIVVRKNIKFLLVQSLQRKKELWLENLQEKEALSVLLEQQESTLSILEVGREDYLRNMAIIWGEEREVWDKLHTIYEGDDKGKIFIEAENGFITSLDYMKEGNRNKARTCQAVSLVPLRALLRMAEETDPLEGVLRDRVERTEDLSKDSYNIELQAMTDMARALIKGVQVEDDISSKMLEILEQNLGDVKDDFYLYCQMKQNESDTFEYLLQNPDDIEKRIRALKTKFQVRAAVEKGKDLAEIIALLGKKENLEKAFSLWDPSGYAFFRVKGLLREYQAVSNNLNTKILNDLLSKTQKVVQEVEDHQEKLMPILNDTLRSVQCMEKKKPLGSRLYFDGAVHDLKDIVRKEPDNSEQKLQEAIEEEKICLDFTGRLDDICSREGSQKELLEIPIRVQNRALSFVKDFEGDEQAVKLVKQGSAEAEESKKYIAQNEWNNAQNKEIRAKEYWEKALNKKDDEDKDEQQQQTASVPNQVLEIYQEMEREDSNDRVAQQPLIKKGLRPW